MQCATDDFDHAFDVAEHFPVWEVQHAIASFIQAAVAHNVAIGIYIVRIAVELYDEFVSAAYEIAEERADLDLTAKFRAKLRPV